MRRTSYLLALLAVLLVAPATAQAAPLWGKYIQVCPQAHVAKVDPIVTPGGVADHNHLENGGTAWSSTSTTGDLLAGGTTCHFSGNKSAYWVPTFVLANGTQWPTGQPGDPKANFSTYYAAGGKDTRAIAGGQVQPFPNGLRMIAGNSKSTVIQSTSIQHWRCGGSTSVTSSPKEDCTAGVSGSLKFPSCWNGTDLDSPDHKAHMAYPVNVTLAGGEVVRGCPSTHPVAVPFIDSEFNFPYPPGGWQGSMLDSDHGVGPRTRTWHGDVWEAQDPMRQAEVTKCLNDQARNFSTAPLCGVFTYATSPWLAPLNEWAEEIRSITPSGQPGALPS